MGKGASRKFDKEMKAPRPAVAVATLSPEDAERAAAAIVPLWQFDEAPFAAGAQVAESDLASLAGVGAMPLALQLAPAPVLGAAIAPIVSDPTVVTPAPTDGGADGESGDPELMSRATVRMAPLLQPLPARPTEPSLPSVIVEETVALAAEASSSVIVAPDPAPPVVAAPAPEPVVVAAPPAPLREPKTDPPAARAPSKQPVPSEPRSKRDRTAEAAAPISGSGYTVPRSRTPLVLGGIGGAALVVLAGYFVNSAMSAPEPPAKTTTVATSVTPGAPTVPVVAIPPPPPPPPVVVANPTPPPPRTAPPPASQPPAPKWSLVPPSSPPHKPPPKNSSPPPSTGGIVRDNPF